MAFVIRPATAEDAAAFAAILAEGAVFMRQKGDGRWSPEDIAAERVDAWIAAGEAVLALEGDVTAVMLLQWRDLAFWPERDDGMAGYLHKVAVRRAAAGRGAVDALVAWAVEETRRRGRKFLRLDTGPWPKVWALYERLGFVELDRIASGSQHIVRFERRIA